MERLAPAERLEVINAHPRLGLDPAQLSALSRREQSGGGDGGAAAEAAALQRLRELNDAYEERFGFRFVEFVAGRPKSALVPVLEQRMRNTRDDELRTGLEHMLRIARDRLRKLSGAASL